MDVWTSVSGTDVKLKNKGVMFAVFDDDGLCGTLYVNRSGVHWYRRKKKRYSDHSLNWKKIIESRGFGKRESN
jgi:hypothetical protein